MNSKVNRSDFIYCSGCMKDVQPIVYSVILRDMIIEDEYYEDIYDETGEEIIDKKLQTEKTGEFKQITEILECPNSKCHKTFMRTYSEGDILKDTEIVPSDKPWHLKTRDDLRKSIPHRKAVTLYQEAVNAYNRNMNYSCGFLLGAVIESICNLEGVKEDLKKETSSNIISLQKQINRLVESGKLDIKFKKLTEGVKELRNDVVHDIHIPSSKELLNSLKIIEAVLEEIYVLNYDKTIKNRDEKTRLLLEKRQIQDTLERKSRR